MNGKRAGRGLVALEFLFLFPFVMVFFYAAASYGITFFAKYKMQSAVDRAVASALYIDRSQYSAGNLKGAVEGRAKATLDQIAAALPAWPASPVGECETNFFGADPDADADDGKWEMVVCSLTYKEYSKKGNPIVPSLDFGMLGSFPPLPSEIKVEARAAF